LEPINSIKAAPGNILTKKQSGYESLKKSKAFGKILWLLVVIFCKYMIYVWLSSYW
jgi:hypothetical protein